MSHLRLVTAPDPARAGQGEGRGRIPAQRTAKASDQRRSGTPADPGQDATQSDRLVPARLLLALAGRCSCPACCDAFVAGRAEPHDPRLISHRHLSAV